MRVTNTKAGALSYVGVDKICSKGGGVSASSGSDKFVISTGVPIFDFACCLSKNPDNLYLSVVGITPSPKITIRKKIDVCNYDKNNVENKEK